MKTVIRLFWCALLIGSIAVVVLMMGGCGSRKRTLETTEKSVETFKAEKSNELQEKNIVSESIAFGKSETITLTENQDIALTQADAEKEITLTDANGRVTKIKGANALISSRKETMSKKDTFGQNLSKIDLSKTVKSDESTAQSTETEKAKAVAVDRKTGIPWWLWIIAALALVAYLIASFYKKSLDPFGFFGRKTS